MSKRSSKTKSTTDSTGSASEQDTDYNEQYVTLNILREMMSAQERVFRNIMETLMNSTISRVDALTKDVAKIEAGINLSRSDSDQIKDELKANQQVLSQLKESLEFSQVELDQCKTVVQENLNNNIKSDVSMLKDKTTYLENQSRRKNIRVDGITEEADETWEATECKVKKILKEKLNLTEVPRIERAHRTGRLRNPDGSHRAKPRTVVCKLYDWKVKETILKAARTVRPPGLFVNEDYAEATVMRRKELLPQMKAANLVLDKLIIKNRGPVPGSSSESREHRWWLNVLWYNQLYHY